MRITDKISAYLKEEKMNMEKIHSRIKDFFKKNPNPKDKQVHALAQSLGIDEHEFEEHIYMILGSLLKEDKVKGGLADKKKPSDFDQKELKMGIEVEMEHTDDRKLAREIAMDHLMEIPDYYTRLKKMEKDSEDQKKVNELMEINPSVVKNLSPKVADLQMLRFSMISELDAVNIYETFADLTKNQKIKQVMLDVAEEEKVHVGEFKRLMKNIDPKYQDFEDDGESEVGEM